MNEAVFPPVWCSLTFCVLTKYNMIMRVEIEATERHSDQHWYSLSVGARPNFEGAPGWRTGSTQTHLFRLEVPPQCFNMHYGPIKACPNHREGAQWTCHYSRAVYCKVGVDMGDIEIVGTSGHSFNFEVLYPA